MMGVKTGKASWHQNRKASYGMGSVEPLKGFQQGSNMVSAVM